MEATIQQQQQKILELEALLRDGRGGTSMALTESSAPPTVSRDASAPPTPAKQPPVMVKKPVEDDNDDGMAALKSIEPEQLGYRFDTAAEDTSSFMIHWYVFLVLQIMHPAGAV